MKLTAEELEQGRAFVRAGDLSGLEAWVDRRGMIVSKDVLHDTMGRTMKRDPELAVKLYDKVFPDMDPELDRRIIKVKIAIFFAVVIVVGLGCLGGIVYLIKAVF